MVDAMGDPSIAELNISRLNGRQATANEIFNHAAAAPFLTERRLVIVEHALESPGGNSAGEKLISVLDKLPSTATVVLLVDDVRKNRQIKGHWVKQWDKMNESHWLTRWLAQSGSRSEHREYLPMDPIQMRTWLQKQAENIGGKIADNAADALAVYVGGETRWAYQEIVKLLTYVNFSRPIDQKDVDLIVTPIRQADVFEMVDAMALGNTRRAADLLNTLLEEDEALSVFGMIIRQFRLLLQAREAMDDGIKMDEAEHVLGQQRFVVKKLWEQAPRFSLTRLKEIYHHLLQIDLDYKTGRIPFELAMDLFIADMGKKLSSST